jgi:hypothetical protein
MDTESEDFQSYNKTLYLRATVQLGDDPYEYWVSNRSESDGEMHYYLGYLALPGAEVNLYSTAEPTEEDISDAQEAAQMILDNMNQGEWEICSTQVLQSSNSSGEDVYSIQLAATKLYQGVAGIYTNFTVNLTGEDVYTSTYGMESVTFTYSGGQLIAFDYENPVEVVSTINDNVAIISFQEATDALETWAGNTEISTGMGLTDMDVNISRVELGLYQVRIQNNDTDYYWLPCYAFFGTSSVYPFEDDNQAIAMINAVDGSVVDIQSGY